MSPHKVSTLMSSFSSSDDNLPITIATDAPLNPCLTVEMFKKVAIPYEDVKEIRSPLGGVRVLITPNLVPIDYPIPVYATYYNDRLYILANTGLSGHDTAEKHKLIASYKNHKDCSPRSLDYYIRYLENWVNINLPGSEIHWFAVNRTPVSNFATLVHKFAHMYGTKVPSSLMNQLLNCKSSVYPHTSCHGVLNNIFKINDLDDDAHEMLIQMKTSLVK